MKIAVTLRTAAFLLLLHSGICLAQSVNSPARHALIICNQNYTALSQLRTPLAEAREAEKTFAALGFGRNITVVTDASTAKMIEAVDAFAMKLGEADIAIFLYGGHAVQAGGENYFLGVDSDPTTVSQLSYKALPLGRVLANLEDAGARLNLLILDCCRDNPLPMRGRSIGGTRGLAPVSAPTGTLIAYAAEANQQAWDDHGEIGLYGSILFEALKKPGLRLEDIFMQTRQDVTKIAREKYGHQQEPAEYTKTNGIFYFQPPTVNSAVLPAAAPKRQMDPFSAAIVSGSWRVVEKVAPQHGGWTIIWSYQATLVDGDIVFVGQKTWVNGKQPTPGERQAVSRLRFAAGVATSVGRAEEVNHRGERLLNRIETVFDESWQSFSIQSFAGNELISTLTGSKQ